MAEKSACIQVKLCFVQSKAIMAGLLFLSCGCHGECDLLTRESP